MASDLSKKYEVYVSNVKQDAETEQLMNRQHASSTSSTSGMSALEAVVLKKHLRFFFMNPIQKWNVKRRFPYKFVVQVIKIILVTIQLYIFAETRYDHMNYALNNKVAFCHIFLKNWDSSKEVSFYPPAAGPFAIYEKSEFYSTIDFAVDKYSNLSDNSIGSYSYIEKSNESAPMEFCVHHYEEYSNASAEYRPKHLIDCYNITLPDIKGKQFSIKKFLGNQNVSINFDYLLRILLKFPIEAVTYHPAGRHCFKFHITISLDNRNLDGQILIDLYSQMNKLGCNYDKHFASFNPANTLWQIFLNVTVMLTCLISFVLCTRAIYRAQLLKYKTMSFFRRVKKVGLSLEGKLQFWSFWYIMIILNDILIIIGSYMQGKVSQNEYQAEEWSICALCLGTGNMLVWFGVLRYFEFFNTYNVVMLTLKNAFPKMLRFLLCAMIIYSGYVFCGWLVLGPFHIKFRSLSTVSECLFSLINGDDMFATFVILQSKSLLLWWYARIYLYSFICLFVYVILSLFLSVIIDAYETIKEFYMHGYPKSDLQMFISEGDDDVEILSDVHNDYSFWKYIKSLATCNYRKNERNIQEERPN